MGPWMTYCREVSQLRVEIDFRAATVAMLQALHSTTCRDQ